LFDHATSEIGVDQTTFDALHRFPESRISETLLPGEPLKPAILEDARYGCSPAQNAISH
jgi:hypothetical protein